MAHTGLMQHFLIKYTSIPLYLTYFMKIVLFMFAAVVPFVLGVEDSTSFTLLSFTEIESQGGGCSVS